MGSRKMTTVNVRATRQQAARWGGAAQYDGAPSIAAWLATLATERLRYLGRYVPRLALHWRRGCFRVMERHDGHGKPRPREVSGLVAGPFGIHKDPRDYLPPLFHLVHAPTGCHLVALRLRKRCKSLARELATFRVDWSATDPEKMTGPEMWKVRDAINGAHRTDFEPQVEKEREA
jgi:hypothetical protein